jgi:hypothetical protein
MTRPFFQRLNQYYAKIGEVLRSEIGVSSIFPNTTDIGMSRERIYAQILQLHLPSSCNVAFGGFLFDQTGKESEQIDILVTNDSSLRFNFENKDGTGKSFACVDGCMAAVSVKSKLDSDELENALLNLASIPDKKPLRPLFAHIGVKNHEGWPYKIIFALNGMQVDNFVEAYNKFLAAHPDISFEKLPDLIHVVGKYAVLKLKKDGGTTKTGQPFPPEFFIPFTDHPDVLGIHNAISNIQQIAVASRYIHYDYQDMLGKVLLCEDC